MLCKATQDGQVIKESSEKTWSLEEVIENHPSTFGCENLKNTIKGQNDMTLKDESPTSESAQYDTGEEWRRTTNNTRKNEAARPKQKWCSVVDESGDESKIWCCKEQYCIGTWNVRSMNQGK